MGVLDKAIGSVTIDPVIAEAVAFAEKCQTPSMNLERAGRY